MRASSLRFGLMLALALVSPGQANAQKLDKDDKTFLDEVRPILLQDEERTYKGLKEKSDRLEFQKIFWARRDPDLATPANEYQAEYEKARAEADRLYRLPAQAGSLTDCGRVFILLGKPDEVQKESETFTPGLRSPEIWTYRDRPGRSFTGGKAAIAFDEECRAPSALAAQMDRVAGSLVVQPSLEYRNGKDGRLVKLADMLPKDTAARALLKQPRQDFPTALQTSYLKIADGGTALLGLVRGEAAGLATSDSAGAKTARVSVVASAVGEDGKEAGWTEQAVNVAVEGDGSFVAGFKLPLRPGKYTLKAGAVDEKGGKGSLTSIDRGSGPGEGRVGRGRYREQAAFGRLADHREAHRRDARRHLGPAAPLRGFRARHGAARAGVRRNGPRVGAGGVRLPGVRPEDGPDDRQGRRQRRRQHPEGRQDSGGEGPAQGDRVRARRGVGRADPARQLRPGQVRGAAQGHGQAGQARGGPGGAAGGVAVGLAA
jgi:GWxTD domain-containing protein